LLLRFETQLRRFIDKQMTNAFGPEWPKHRLPKGMYEKWQEKKRAQYARARNRPLIAYADFNDYPLVICKGDNWREVFAPFYNRQESVRESFQRLHPVRLDTMHARPITQYDELLLYVETQHLLKVTIISKIN
jgi:HEPN superfamily Swt1-like protein